MARPAKKRTADKFQRDIETLSRLRMALQLRHALQGGEESEEAIEAIGHIDSLVISLSRLMRIAARKAVPEAPISRSA